MRDALGMAGYVTLLVLGVNLVVSENDAASMIGGGLLGVFAGIVYRK